MMLWMARRNNDGATFCVNNKNTGMAGAANGCTGSVKDADTMLVQNALKYTMFMRSRALPPLLERTASAATPIRLPLVIGLSILDGLHFISRAVKLPLIATQRATGDLGSEMERAGEWRLGCGRCVQLLGRQVLNQASTRLQPIRPTTLALLHASPRQRQRHNTVPCPAHHQLALNQADAAARGAQLAQRRLQRCLLLRERRHLGLQLCRRGPQRLPAQRNQAGGQGSADQ